MHYDKNRIAFFFIDTGLIIYHTFSIALLICIDVALKHKANDLALKYLTFYRVAFIIMHLFIGTGLLVFKAPRRYIDPNEFPD